VKTLLKSNVAELGFYGAATEDNADIDLCGINLRDLSEDAITWFFVENKPCWLKLKPFRGV